MSIEYRDIMQCEQLNELPDGAYVVVIDNGDMKIISKADAGLGRVPVTEYNLVEDNVASEAVDTGVAVQSESSSWKLHKEDDTEPTIQEVYNALNNGTVILKHDENGDGRVFYKGTVTCYAVNYTDGVPVYLSLEASSGYTVRLGKTILS